MRCSHAEHRPASRSVRGATRARGTAPDPRQPPGEGGGGSACSARQGTHKCAKSVRQRIYSVPQEKSKQSPRVLFVFFPCWFVQVTVAHTSGNASNAVSTARDRGEAVRSSMPSDADPFCRESQAATACLRPSAVKSASTVSSCFMVLRNFSCEQPAASAASARGLCSAWPWRRRKSFLLIMLLMARKTVSSAFVESSQHSHICDRRACASHSLRDQRVSCSDMAISLSFIFAAALFLPGRVTQPNPTAPQVGRREAVFSGLAFLAAAPLPALAQKSRLIPTASAEKTAAAKVQRAIGNGCAEYEAYLPCTSG